jgi:glycosyltransferase involved in cell wall biosynthesis
VRVSVVIPAFNGERFLADAVASVQAQDYGVHEIVVVDDGSTDGTAELAAQLETRVVRQENQGPAAARNRGIGATTGEVIAFLDCDDLWTPGSLARRMGALEEDAELRVVLGRFTAEYLPGALMIEYPADDDGSLTSVKFSTGVFRREVFDRVGPLDPSFRQAEDVDWFLRALELRVPMRIVDNVSVVYRRHRANLTCDHDLHQAYFARALRRSLERRRAAGHDVAPLPTWSELDERTAGRGHGL